MLALSLRLWSFCTCSKPGTCECWLRVNRGCGSMWYGNRSAAGVWANGREVRRHYKKPWLGL